MKPPTTIPDSNTRKNVFPFNLRQKYWNAWSLLNEWVRLFKLENRVFLKHTLRNFWHFSVSSIQPIEDEILPRIRAGIDWLLTAQQATPDAGVSIGYFPCRAGGNGWLPSYPETTGYIITTLLAYANRFQEPKSKHAALEMAHWEISIQMPSGAVQGGPVCLPEKQTPAAFNTGMVLDGWCSAYLASNDMNILDAARRAADFLVADIDENGYFRTNGDYVGLGKIKTYTCLCAWSLYRFGEITGEPIYKEASVRVIEAALRQQLENGWFAHNCLTNSFAPLTHTIGYTLQGVLEVGLLAKRMDFIEATRKCVDPLIAQIDHQGILAGRYDEEWRPAIRSSCLTGNAQIAVVCYQLYKITGVIRYKLAADKLVNALKSLQHIDSTNNYSLNGAISGSFPIFGSYMRGGYPNWATKYFVDALMLQYQYSK
jgi:hypothetical protein